MREPCMNCLTRAQYRKLRNKEYTRLETHANTADKIVSQAHRHRCLMLQMQMKLSYFFQKHCKINRNGLPSQMGGLKDVNSFDFYQILLCSAHPPIALSSLFLPFLALFGPKLPYPVLNGLNRPFPALLCLIQERHPPLREDASTVCVYWDLHCILCQNTIVLTAQAMRKVV